MTYNNFYYQINYINKDGITSYIKTFEEDELELAKEYLDILNEANMCLNSETKFVLDKYEYGEETDKDICIAYNITDVNTINEYLTKVKEALQNDFSR